MKKKLQVLFVLLCFAIAIMTINLQAFADQHQPQNGNNEYYCDPVNGSMDNQGTLESPWGKLEDVFKAKMLFEPGDVIHLMSGDHGIPVITQSNEDYVTITRYGNDTPVLTQVEFSGASRWILDNVEIYSTDPPPEEPVLQHPVYPLLENTLIRVRGGSSYITLSNCYVYSIEDSSSWTANDWNYKAWNGINVYEESQYVTVDSCHFKNLNFPVTFSSYDQQTLYNTAKNCLIENFCGDGVRIDADYSTVENCVIKDCYKTNGNHCDMIQGYSSLGLKGSVLRGNIIISVSSADRPYITSCQGIGLFDGWHDDFVIENNLVIVHHWHGISLYGGRNCRISNNTVVKNPIGNYSSTPWIGFFNMKGGMPGSGNIMNNNFTPDIESASGATLSNNIVSSDYDAYFVDYEGFDMHLKPGSPAINAGTSNNAPSIDLEGNVRLEPYDVGCYEYYSLEQLEEFILYGVINGEITNHGIINSLLVKVEHAQEAEESGNKTVAYNTLNALKNEVSAQSGKHISAGFAKLLVENISILMSRY